MNKFEIIKERLIYLAMKPPEDLPYTVKYGNETFKCFYENGKAGIDLRHDWFLQPQFYYYKNIDGELYQFFITELDTAEDLNIFIAMMEEDFPEVLHDLLNDKERKQAMDYLVENYPDYYE